MCLRLCLSTGYTGGPHVQPSTAVRIPISRTWQPPISWRSIGLPPRGLVVLEPVVPPVVGFRASRKLISRHILQVGSSNHRCAGSGLIHRRPLLPTRSQ